MDRAQKKYFRYFFSPSPLRLLWGWYHDLQSKYIGPGAFSRFQTRFRKIKLLKILKGDNVFFFLRKEWPQLSCQLFICLLAFNGERGDSFVLTSFQIVCCCSLGMLLSPNIIKFEANLHFSLCPHLAVGITVATVKTNLIIIRVMFFGICVHLPANFDGICRPLTLSLLNIFRAKVRSPSLSLPRVSSLGPGIVRGSLNQP